MGTTESYDLDAIRTSPYAIDYRSIDAILADIITARKEKDYPKADRLRAFLNENGIEVSYDGAGAAWKRTRKAVPFALRSEFKAKPLRDREYRQGTLHPSECEGDVHFFAGHRGQFRKLGIRHGPV